MQYARALIACEIKFKPCLTPCIYIYPLSICVYSIWMFITDEWDRYTCMIVQSWESVFDWLVDVVRKVKTSLYWLRCDKSVRADLFRRTERWREQVVSVSINDLASSLLRFSQNVDDALRFPIALTLKKKEKHIQACTRNLIARSGSFLLTRIRTLQRERRVHEISIFAKSSSRFRGKKTLAFHRDPIYI